MNYLIGIDGGGTKTAYILGDTEGHCLQRLTGETISYNSLGIEPAIERLKAHISQLLAVQGACWEEIAGVVAGIPCYGENRELDAAYKTRFYETFEGAKVVHLVNDVEVGYYGSLDGVPGIHLVSGTGSIAFGMDEAGSTARAGGWSEHFGDEGSCYWLGMHCMRLFTKESDGRVAAGALLDVVRAHFGTNDDFEIANRFTELLASRKEVGQLQRLLAEAARRDDEAAKRLYSDTAQELFDLAAAIKKQLHFTGTPVKVALSGGILHVADLFLEALKQKLEAEGMTMVPAQLEPVMGAYSHCCLLYRQ